MPYMSANAAIRAERIRSLQNHDDRATQLAQNAHDSGSGWTAFHRGYDRRDEADSPGGPPLGSLGNSIGHLDEANSRLRALLDLTTSVTNSIVSPRPRVADITVETSTGSTTIPVFRRNELPDDSNRRNKRRKIDAERQISNFKGFRYGKYGQLEPGQLQMEMVSCDGGMFSNRAAYSAENILRDDNSVYCTKGNRCNIVLRHQGATAFTIQELVIKAPASMNFSHP